MIASMLPDLPLSLLSNWFLQNWVERSFMMGESALLSRKSQNSEKNAFAREVVCMNTSCCVEQNLQL